MNKVNSNSITMISAVVGFCGNLQPQFQPGSKGQQLVTEIGFGLLQLREVGGAQVSGKTSARQGVRRKKVAAQNLLAQMRVIRGCAIALEPEFSGIRRKFQVPTSGRNEQATLASARSFISHATPLKEKFIEVEAPATFLEDLKAAIAEVENAASDKSLGRGGQVEGTAGLSAIGRETVAKVRQLGGLIEARFAKQPGVLAEWRSASRLPRRSSGEASSPAAAMAAAQ